MPTHLSMLPLQGLTYFFVPMVYIGSVVAAGLEQPQWMNSLALPDTVYGVALEGHHKNAARVLARVLSITLRNLSDDVFEHLEMTSFISSAYISPFFSESSLIAIVQAGPFAWVRPPLYAYVSFMMHSGFWTVMFVSSVLLVVATAAVYAVKIPIEGEAILRDDAVKEEYRTYMRKVPARLVPCIW
ncbi:hypothetical protein EV363DRAFT_1586775 [Boletus edulis]|nr:hypothetical protein EV363DRAFT_1586775 [Boletus edulis]